jgi:transglutaminase-like putative cysteine protease
MRQPSDRGRELALFLLRSLLLYFLLVNSFLQLHDLLDLAFQSAAFLVAVLAGLAMERARLRFLPSLLLAALLPVALRVLFFLVFRLQRAIASGPATDFLFFYFDKDFFPALAAYAIAWVFTFLALRHRSFIAVEAALNSLLLLLVFWTQAGYHLTIYPHPSVLAWLLALFIVAEFFVLMLAGVPSAGGRDRVDLRAAAGFSWILVPLLLLFLLFLLGKYGEGAVKAGMGLMKPTLFRFDFAPYVKLESEIRTSEEAVLLFRTAGKAERFLLRRFVLSRYTADQGFSMERGGPDDSATIVPDSPVVFPDPGYRDRQTVRQEYFFLTLDPSSLISLNYPVRVAPLKNWKSSSFLRVYRVDSKAIRSDAGPRKVEGQPPLSDPLARLYTRGGGDPEIADLALQITRGQGGYFGKVAAIEDYLRSNYLYSLKPGIAEDGNQLRHFLFVSKKGYCSYFAFAMALMCRSLGIPARVAVGFYVDPRSEVLNFYEVRAFQAHAWVEVWFGDLGWVEFDPTSSTPAPGEDFVPFPAPDKERMARLIAEIVRNQSDLEEHGAAAPRLVGSASRFGRELARIVLLAARLWYITLPTLYLLFLLTAKLMPSLPGLLSGNPRARVKARHRLCLVRLGGVRLARAPAESAMEHAARLCRARGINFVPPTELYLKAVFGETFDAMDEEAMGRAVAGFLSSYRSRLSFARRAAGLIGPLGALPRRP